MTPDPNSPSRRVEDELWAAMGWRQRLLFKFGDAILGALAVLIAGAIVSFASGFPGLPSKVAAVQAEQIVARAKSNSTNQKLEDLAEIVVVLLASKECAKLPLTNPAFRFDPRHKACGKVAHSSNGVFISPDTLPRR